MESSLQCHYELREEGEKSYSFTTKHGIKYNAYFIDFSVYHEDFQNVYAFNIEQESETPHPIDKRIAITVVEILKIFFEDNANAMIMVCDTFDGKEEKRRKLFDRWFHLYNEGRLVKYDASAEDEGYTLYVSLYMLRNNSSENRLVKAFYELVKNNLYPL